LRLPEATVLNPAAFRRDPWLRTSGYHLATWSLVAFVLELVRTSDGAAGMSSVVVLLAGGVLSSFTHERRVAKMAGAAGDPVYENTALLWGLVALALISAGVAAAGAPVSDPLFPVAMVIVGIGFAQWGAGAHFPWFVGLGSAIVAVGLLDVAISAPARPYLRMLVLGVLLPAAGIETSRRYLWFRQPDQP
jgi:hypothetical protein